jgi:signal transduction histidine kinase
MWQWQEYQVECETARDDIGRQAKLLMIPLVGDVQPHRRLGLFFEEQLQSLLDDLSKSQDVVAVAIVTADQRLSLTAGKADLLNLSSHFESGQSWQPGGFRYAVAFQVPPEPPMPSRPTPGTTGTAGQGGVGINPQWQGSGRGMGWGRMGGSSSQPDATQSHKKKSGLSAGERCFAVLLLDRTRTDQQIAHYANLRFFVVLAGGLVILSVALAWRATVRLADAHGQARLLEIESRHFRDLSQAAAGLAHETRNPLGLIRGWAQRWAQTAVTDSVQRQQSQAVIEECDRVTARINQFLAFTRPCTPQLSEVRPVDVISELAVVLEPDLDAKHLRLVTEPAADLPTIQADREMLRQALFNLVQNAIQFSPENAAVEIAVAPNADGIRVEVADHGPGVPPEEVERLFTPYYTTRSGGTGLGLAIVRRIAASHGWESGYSPRPGGGSIFWIAIQNHS